MSDFAFHFSNVSFRKTNSYTLTFKGSCTHSNGRQLIIRYTGAEIFNESAVAISFDFLDQLRREFVDDYGYGPFNSKDAKAQLKTKGSYFLDYSPNN